METTDNGEVTFRYHNRFLRFPNPQYSTSIVPFGGRHRPSERVHRMHMILLLSCMTSQGTSSFSLLLDTFQRVTWIGKLFRIIHALRGL